jgi:hypothetical protein
LQFVNSAAFGVILVFRHLIAYVLWNAPPTVLCLVAARLQDGYTAAIHAVDEGRADCLRMLVDAKADVNHQDKVSACMCAGRVRRPLPQDL